MAGLRKVKINWNLLRSFDPTPILTLEQELEEGVRQEYQERRIAHLTRKKEAKRRRRKGFASTAAEEATLISL